MRTAKNGKVLLDPIDVADENPDPQRSYAEAATRGMLKASRSLCDTTGNDAAAACRLAASVANRVVRRSAGKKTDAAEKTEASCACVPHGMFLNAPRDSCFPHRIIYIYIYIYRK